MQAIILRLPDHTYVTIRMCLQMNMLQLNFCFFFVLSMVMHVEEGGGVGGGLDCEQSQFFFRFSEGSACGFDRPRKERTTRSLGEGGERKIIF